MSLSLQEVFSKVNKQPDTRFGYIFDNPIHYIVLNTKVNIFTLDLIAFMTETIDKIEKCQGPGVIVTLGTGSKTFSGGFDLGSWAVDPIVPLECVI